ncbi:MAG: hypothetical protein ACRED0_04645, partial [Gammaproteobacteria bacterium]
MRGRRPELFSDSIIVQTPTITREQLEYQLETLTARKLETAFEHFCRELAQREICPNLIPQTGPTGGGDSKVDSETYPVSDEISLRWYHAEAEQAGKKRWAFAFSAKKDWAGKVRSDVRGIAETRRHYDLVYFISSQFVPDKQRAAKEEQLSAEFGIPLRILDRSW